MVVLYLLILSLYYYIKSFTFANDQDNVLSSRQQCRTKCVILIKGFVYSNIVNIPRVRTTNYGKKNSFKYTAAVLWNDLPDNFRKISNFNQFKNILKSWNGNDCKCSVCADL